MPTVEINDISIHYERSGRRPAILFVHGMCGDADVFAGQAERLSNRYCCVRYDRRGHTRSTRGDATQSDALHADDAAALIGALDLAPCLLIGSSGGAAIGIDVALRYGGLLRGAVFSEPPLFSLGPDAARALTAELVPSVERSLADGGPRAAVDTFFSFVCPGLWSSIDEGRKDRYRDNAQIGLADLRSPSTEATVAELAGVGVPALVIAGERSHPSLRAIAGKLAAALPDARLVELAGSGHVTYAERPDAFAGAVAAFAAELDGCTTTSPDRRSRP